MKKVEKISEGANYSAVTIGRLDELKDHKLVIAEGMEIPGKVFVGNVLKSTGTEVSFQVMPPAAGGEFLHKHKNNEELYFVISGSGEYQVDGEIFPISEGSVIRVSPEGKRSWRNTSSEPMVMMCIQSEKNSLRVPGISDGEILNEKVIW